MKKKKNILFVSCYAYMKGGGQESLYQLLKLIDRDRYNVYVVFPHNGSFVEMVDELGIKTEIIPMMNFNLLNILGNINGVLKFFTLLLRLNIDLIHTDNPRVTFYAGVAAKFLKIPLVWHIRVNESDGFFDKVLVFLTTKLILVSESIKERFKWINDYEKLEVIYNGIDLNKFSINSNDNQVIRKKLNLSKDCFLICQIGRIEELKGQEFLIQAVNLIKDSLGDFRVILIGSDDGGYKEKLKELVAKCSLNENIIFWGESNITSQLICDIDIMVHPSLAESFGRVIVEAMALKKPVIASDVGGIPEIINDNVNGYLTPLKDINKISEKILFLKENEDIRLNIGNAARKRAEDKFSILTNVTKTQDLYEKIFSKTGNDFGDTRPVKFKKKFYLYSRNLFFIPAYYCSFNRRKKEFKKQDYENIVVVLLARIGDSVLMLSFLESLRENFNQAKISILVNSYTKDVFMNNPNIDYVILFDDKKDHEIINSIRCIKKIRERGFDLVFDLTSDYQIKTALFSYFLKPSFSVGYNTNYRGFLFNKSVLPPKKVTHQKDVYLKLLEELDLALTDEVPKIYINESDRNNAFNVISKIDNSFKKDKINFAICPGAFYNSQCWKEDRFAKISDEIYIKFNVNIIFLGGNKDKEKITRICDLMKAKPTVVSGYSLKESISILSICNFFVGNNSGLLHIASSLNIPTVSIMGPTVYGRWFPLGEKNAVLKRDIDCRPCNKGYCESHECMDISVSDVMGKIVSQFNLIKKQ